MIRILTLSIVLCLACVVKTKAQAIQIDVEDAALEEVLEGLRFSANINVVFATRLVEGVRATCTYSGADAVEALACILSDTGLAAERVRRRQFVLRPAAAAASSSSDGSPDQVQRVSISGFVRDAATGELLPGAHVFLPDFRVGASTNDAGYFAVPSLPPGEYTVRVSFIGFASLEQSVSTDSDPQTFRLEPLAVQTEGVLVEKERSTIEGMPPPSGVVSVSVRELERLPTFPGEQDLLHALQWFPGVQKAGEVNGGLVVRGGAPDQNLYLIDGAPVYHPWHAFSLISTFQTETFSDVKLYRGAFPAEHGGRISSVLDAHLKDGNRDGPSATAALGALSGRFMIESPLTRRSSFMLSGRRSYIDKLIGDEHAVEDVSGRRDTLRTGYFFHDLAAKVAVWNGARHRLSASYYRGGDQLDVRLPFDLSLDFSSWLRPADLFFEIDQFWNNDVVALRYQYLLGSRFFTTFTAYHSSYEAKEGAVIRPSARAHLLSDYSVSLSDLGAKWDAEWYFALQHELRAGLHVVDHDFRSNIDATIIRSAASADTLSQYSRQRGIESSAYVQHTWRPSSHLRIQPGVRAGFFGGGKHLDISPRVGLQYAPVPDRIMFRAAGGRYVQYMHRLRDRYSFLYDLVSSRWIATGENVRPSRSRHLTVGAELRPWNGVTLSSDTYWYEAHDVLLPEDDFQEKDGLEGPGIDVAAILGQYAAGDARSYGVEVDGRFNHGRWDVWISYAGSRSLTRAHDASARAFRPGRFDVPRTFRGIIAHQWRRVRLSLSVDARSGYPHTVPVARYVMGDALDDPDIYLYRPSINNGRLPSYYHLDANLQYRFSWVGARWNASLQLFNITNNRNVIGRQYIPQDGTIEIRDRRGFPFLPLFEIEMRI